MTHEHYNELQKKLDKLYSDYVDILAEVDNEDDVKQLFNWLDNETELIINWSKVNGGDDKIIYDITCDYEHLKGMALC